MSDIGNEVNRIAVKLRRSSDPFPVGVASERCSIISSNESGHLESDWKETVVPWIPLAILAFPRNRQENSRTIDSTERIERSIRPTARNTGCFSRQRVYKVNTTRRTCVDSIVTHPVVTIIVAAGIFMSEDRTRKI